MTCRLQPVAKGILRGAEGPVIGLLVVNIVVVVGAVAGTTDGWEECSILYTAPIVARGKLLASSEWVSQG